MIRINPQQHKKHSKLADTYIWLMTQVYGQPDYSTIQRRSRLYDSGLQVLYFTILLTVLGTGKRYYSRPYILDFHFILLSCKRFHVYRSIVIQLVPEAHNNIAMTDNLAVKPLWLFMSKRKQWCVRLPGPAFRYQLLDIHSTNHHMCWSTVSQMAPDN